MLSLPHLGFALRHSFVIRDSRFVIVPHLFIEG